VRHSLSGEAKGPSILSLRRNLECQLPFKSGYLRLTNDVDIVVRLDRGNVRAAFEALQAAGYGPSVPVTAEQFGDPETRERLIREKGMQVLGFWSDVHPDTPVDLFVAEPFDFDAERAAAFEGELAPGLTVPFVRLATLIRMKEEVGRPRDLDDAQHLRWILESGA